MIRSQRNVVFMSYQRRIQVWCYCCLFLFTLISVIYGQDVSNCISSINDIESAELLITDYSIVRQYILCPATTFTIAIQDYYGSVIYETGSTMIHLRPNLHIQCGTSGSRMNNCILDGGTIHIDGTSFFTNSTPTSLSNIIFTGITFTNAQKHFIWIDQPGDVLIRDCAFQVCLDQHLFRYLDVSK
jgi:hypothetical protein